MSKNPIIPLKIKKIDDQFYRKIYPVYFIESIIEHTRYPYDLKPMPLADDSIEAYTTIDETDSLDFRNFTLKILASQSLEFHLFYQVLFEFDQLDFLQLHALNEVFDDERKQFIKLYNKNSELPDLTVILAKAIIRNIVYGVYCGAITRQEIGKLIYDILNLCKEYLTDFYNTGVMISEHDTNWHYLIQEYRKYKKEQGLE